MGKTKYKKIIYINEITFFFGWVIIFLLGADKPPPIGFTWLVLLIIVLDVIQYFYLKKFLCSLNNKVKNLFVKNLLLFILAGVGVCILTILLNIKNFLSLDYITSLIWIMMIIVPSLLYGTYFYIINSILLKIIK